MSSKDGKRKRPLVPRLRFPEFREAGEWVERRIKDICTINPAASGLPDQFIYIDLGSVECGDLQERKLVHRKDAPSRAQRLLEQGDILFQVVRPYQRNNYHFKKRDSFFYVASTGYAQLRSSDLDSFLFQLIHSDQFVNRVVEKCTGSNYPAINSEDLSNITVPYTLKNEQQKIADCLSSLDERITLEAQKLEALKRHKKGLMQQLFPREGENLPRLRFPEFRESLSVLPLANIADLVSDKISISQISLGQYVSTENLLPDFGGMNPSTKLPSVSFVTSFYPNDILISNIRPYLKKVFQAKISGGASNDVLVFRAKKNINSAYLSAILRSDLFIDYVMRGAKGVKMPRGEVSMIQKFPVPYFFLAEQQKMGIHAL